MYDNIKAHTCYCTSIGIDVSSNVCIYRQILLGHLGSFINYMSDEIKSNSSALRLVDDVVVVVAEVFIVNVGVVVEVVVGDADVVV